MIPKQGCKFIYIPNYGIMYQTSTKLHYKHLSKAINIYNNNIEFTDHLIAIRYVAANKDIHEF